MYKKRSTYYAVKRNPSSKGFAENMQELLTWYVQGKVKVVVDEALPLEQATKAMAKVMNREVKGKMVLVP